MKRLLVSTTALSLCATVAHAQIPAPSLSASVGYTKKEDSNLEAVQARLSARFHPNFGIEGEGALGIEPNTLAFPSVPPLTIKNQLRRELGVYAVGYLPVTPNAEVFARVGYGNTWFKRTVHLPPNLAVNKFDADSINFGVGGQYDLDGKNGGRVDYTRQDFSKGVRTEDSWAVSYTRRF